MMKARWPLTLFVFFALAVMLLGTVGGSPARAQAGATPTPSTWPQVIPLISNQPTPVGYGPDEYPPNVNPLTGLVVSDPDNLNRRPMIVKVTNYPRTVRPQSGLSRADIVFEYFMERGISRFIAVFYGQDAERAGPVRSGRFFDEHIFKMYDGFFVFGSADYRIMGYFLDLGWHWVSSFVFDPEDQQHPCDPANPRFLCRDTSMETYNNLFTHTAALEQYVTQRNGNYRPNLYGMRFEHLAPPRGAAAENIVIRYSLFIYNKWTYSPQMGRYLRYEEEIGFSDPNRERYLPHIDALTGEQIAADNVVVLVVPHFFFVKTTTTEILTIPLIGEGPAYFFRDGHQYLGTWERATEVGVLRLYDAWGEPFPLRPGNTWFEVVSQETVLASDTADWRFYFNTPPVPEDLAENPINYDGLNAPYGWFQAEWPEYPEP